MNAARGDRMFRDEIPFWREHIACIREMVSPQMADLAGYHFQRRLLFYYVDACSAGNEEIKRGLVAELRKDRAEMDRIYDSGIASRGDRMRRRLFFLSPALYAAAARLYERIVIPLRRGAVPGNVTMEE